MTQTEQELFERCFTLEGKKFELQDTIEDILDYLMKTNITPEEMNEVQNIAYQQYNEYPKLNENLKKALEII